MGVDEDVIGGSEMTEGRDEYIGAGTSQLIKS